MIISFKEYLEEKVGDFLLYHNTGYSGFRGIMEAGRIGTRSGGRVSFTRDKSYLFAPGAGSNDGSFPGVYARFVYNRETLVKRKKVTPYADRNVQDPKTGNLVSGAGARWESEEKVVGPIPLDKKHGLVRIDVTPELKEYFELMIKRHEETIDSLHLSIEMLEKENKFFHKTSGEWRPIPMDNERITRRFNRDAYEKGIKKSEEDISTLKSIINNPFINVSRFRG